MRRNRSLCSEIAYVTLFLIIDSYYFIFISSPYVSVTILINGANITTWKFRIIRSCCQKMKVIGIERNFFQSITI